MRIGIIGAGASGMAAAISAAQNPQAEIILLERQARVGRKLQATGNGRCNLTNTHALQGGYYGQTPSFAGCALSAFDPEQTLAWFRKLGLFTVTEPSGRVYPYSDQANSVVDVLRFALDRPNIRLLTGFEVERIRKLPNGFRMEARNRVESCDRLIVACGGLAGTKLGGSMSGYQLLRSLGHRCTRLRPSLVQLKCNHGSLSGLKGVRANCHAAIYCNDRLVAQSTGELQFTEYGLSGPVIFEISRDACQGAGQWLCKLDLLPQVSEQELYEALSCRRATNLPVSELLTGILHNRLGRVLAQAAGLSQTDAIAGLSESQLRSVASCVKGFELSLSDTLGMDSAQVTAGGILTEEFHGETMESKLVSGLYACGEVLDIDGACGGYNLQWAWSSGYLAGLHAGGIQ